MNLTWSQEAVVSDPANPGRVLSVFQMATYAVGAEWPDRPPKVRVLPHGLVITHPDVQDDEDYVRALRDRFDAQVEPVVVER